MGGVCASSLKNITSDFSPLNVSLPSGMFFLLTQMQLTLLKTLFVLLSVTADSDMRDVSVCLFADLYYFR